MKCPDCGATGDAIKTFENGCTLLKNASPPHYMCTNCRGLWSKEFLVQRALGTIRDKEDGSGSCELYGEPTPHVE